MHEWPGRVGHRAGAIADQIAALNTERRNQKEANNRSLIERRPGRGTSLDLSHKILLNLQYI
jgi:hypothetical protein